MKRLLASLLLLAACGEPAPTPESPDAGIDPDAAVSDETGSIAATWQLQDDGTLVDCPAGATTAAVHSLLDGDTDDYIDLFNCSALTGTANDLPAGDYQVWIDLTDDTGVTLYAQSESKAITVIGGETAERTFAIDVANGFVDVSWSLVASGGGQVTCAASGGNSTSVLSTQTDTNTAFDDIYQCTDGEAPARVTTGALPLGPYATQLSLLGDGDVVLGQSEIVQFSIDHGTELENLGVVTITMD
jgi:hypothetical protein